MADEEKQLRTRLTKLVATLRELQAKTFEVTEEIDRILGGGAGIGDRIKQFQTAWLATWSSRYHADYLFTATRDVPQIKRLLKAFTAAELQVRMWNYVRNDEPFYVKGRHSFAIFVASINTHGAEPSSGLELDAPTLAGCKHQPPCATDQAHTKRRVAELRA